MHMPLQTTRQTLNIAEVVVFLEINYANMYQPQLVQ